MINSHSNSNNTTSYSVEEWTEEDLEEVLYKNDNSSYPIIEFKYMYNNNNNNNNIHQSIHKEQYNVTTITTASKQSPAVHPTTFSPSTTLIMQEEKSNDTKSKETSKEDKFEKGKAYINIPIEGDDVHIIEFYAPWCPHCQHYKPMYIQLAREVIKRSINVHVLFHAVSCTLNDIVCETYGIEGYPSFLGYRGNGNDNHGDTSSSGQVVVGVGHQQGKLSGVGHHGGGGGDTHDELLVSNTTLRGTPIELVHDLNQDIETIASIMQFDLASLPRNYTSPESKFSDSEDQRQYEADKLERSKEVANEKMSLLDYYASKNQIYHDAILSLIYMLQSGIYYQSNSILDEYDEIVGLYNFLILIHWSTPLSWPMRKTLIKDLLEKFDTIVTQGKGPLINLIEQHLSDAAAPAPAGVKSHEQGLPWGYITNDDDDAPSAQSAQSYKLSRRLWSVRKSLHHITKKNKNESNKKKEVSTDVGKRWTLACNRGPTSRGFTCGLWELLHIISIGSGIIENQLYGFEHGYMISQHDVTDTIRNFIGHFFRCDVCRINFVTMYDNCGHDHCTRLSNESPFVARSHKRTSTGTGTGGRSIWMTNKSSQADDQNEVAIWLWEVHNSGKPKYYLHHHGHYCIHIKIMNNHLTSYKTWVSKRSTTQRKGSTRKKEFY